MSIMGIFSSGKETKEKQVKELIDSHWNRLHSADPSLTRDTKFVNNYSFNDYVYYNFEWIPPLEKRPRYDVESFTKIISLETEEAIRRNYFVDKRCNADFLDLVPRVMRENYPDAADALESRIRDGKYHTINTSYGVNTFSAVAAVDEMIRARNKIFSKIKKSHGNVIDLRPLFNNAYNSLNGMLAYAKTVNDPRYTLSENADKLFRALKGGFKDIDNAHLIYPGLGFLEFEWLKQVGSPRATVYDSSRAALMLYYIFGDYASENELKMFDGSYSSMWGLSEKSLVIGHNGLHCQPVKELRSFMKYIGRYPEIKSFYTIPSVDCMTLDHYGSANNHFSENLKKEFLLCDDPALVKREVIREIPEGYSQDIEFRAEDDVLLRNQYFNDAKLLKKGDVILCSSSGRFHHNMIRDWAEMAQREAACIDGEYAFYSYGYPRKLYAL